MGICNAKLGNDLRATSFNAACKAGVLPVGIAVEQMATIFRLFFNLFYKFNTCTNIFVEINYWIHCCSANRKLQKKATFCIY